MKKPFGRTARAVVTSVRTQALLALAIGAVLVVAVAGPAESPSTLDAETLADAPARAPEPYSDAILGDRPVAYWRLNDEKEATSAVDSSGYENHGTYENLPELGMPPLVPDGRASAGFDATNQRVRIPDTPSLSPTAGVTVEGWVRAKALPVPGGYRTVVANNGSFRLRIADRLGEPRAHFSVRIAGVWHGATAAIPFKADTTYHLVGTYDGSSVRIYQNGVMVGAQAASGEIEDSAYALQISTSSNDSWGGRIDDAAVYDHALGTDAVVAHHGLGSPSPNDCTRVLAAGGNVALFLDSLSAGDVGCLRGGEYRPATDSYLRLDASATLKSYPGERAVIVGRGLWVTAAAQVRNLTIRDATLVDMSCLVVRGQGNKIVGNDLLGCGASNILLGTESRDALIQGTFSDRSGLNSSNDLPDHGIYVQGIGHDIVRNVFVRMQGYGIHAYSSSSGNDGVQPSNIEINGNTTVYSEQKSGILIQSGAGGDIRTYNNIAAFNHDYGIKYQSDRTNCPSGPCPIDTNLVYGNRGGNLNGGAAARATNTIVADPLFVDSQFRISPSSPAVDKARLPLFFPDRDGFTDTVADLGAYK